eukprot:scpid104032/ scgid18800/ 
MDRLLKILFLKKPSLLEAVFEIDGLANQDRFPFLFSAWRETTGRVPIVLQPRLEVIWEEEEDEGEVSDASSSSEEADEDEFADMPALETDGFVYEVPPGEEDDFILPAPAEVNAPPSPADENTPPSPADENSPSTFLCDAYSEELITEEDEPSFFGANDDYKFEREAFF